MPFLLRRLAVLLVAVIALSGTGLSGAHAAEADTADDTVTWMVRPSDGVGEDGRSWIEQELDPGETVTEHLIVRNLSRRAVTFQLSAADGYFTETGRFNMLTADQESIDAGTWIEIAETVDVAPGGDVVVPFTVTVPDNATPGDHPAGVAAAIRSGQDEQIGVESRVGFRVMTRVSGELVPSAALTVSGSYDGSWNPFEPGRAFVDYAVENTGNTRLALEPHLEVSALFGLVRFDVPVEAITDIAPGETRSVSTTLRNIWPLFGYTATARAEANAVTTDDATAPPSVAVTDAASTIVAVPWAQLIALALAALVVWWLRTDRRRRDRKLAALLEQARQEVRDERSPAPNSTATALRRDRSGRATATLAAALLTAGISLCHAPVSASAAPSEDSDSVTLRVEVTPQPFASPTGPVASSPTPSRGALPATGAPDLTLIGAAAILLTAAGTSAAFIAYKRRTDGSSRPSRPSH